VCCHLSNSLFSKKIIISFPVFVLLWARLSTIFFWLQKIAWWHCSQWPFRSSNVDQAKYSVGLPDGLFSNQKSQFG
jgi:hypothetical protein